MRSSVLLTLLAGKEALIPEYDMKTSMPADKSHWTTMKLPPGGKGIVIMEGTINWSQQHRNSEANTSYRRPQKYKREHKIC